MHIYSEVKTDLGTFRIACSSRGITAIRPVIETSTTFESKYKKRFGVTPFNQDIPDVYKQALHKAVTGHIPPTVPIDWSVFTDFQKTILKKLQGVRAGKVQTYSWLAREAGHPKAARAVGNAMAQNPIPFIIPCHRIVPASGGIGNYGLGKKLKHELLSREGVHVEYGSKVTGPKSKV